MQADYLVVGAGALGMAFVYTLIEHCDANVVMIDRRHAPGGHWLDAYPCVRLHQPSRIYGVASTALGQDRWVPEDPGADFFERASGAQIAATTTMSCAIASECRGASASSECVIISAMGRSALVSLAQKLG